MQQDKELIQESKPETKEEIKTTEAKPVYEEKKTEKKVEEGKKDGEHKKKQTDSRSIFFKMFAGIGHFFAWLFHI